jgi:replicative DNA helicase Mcm
MEKEKIAEIFSQFIRENYYEKLVKAVSENVGFLLIDFSLLDKFSPELASYLLENPEETIEACEEAIKQIDTGLGEAELRLRFVNLPEDRQIRIRNIRSQHLGKMIVVDGFVKRASEIRPEVCETVYQCPECGNTITITQKERALKTPERCEACGNKKGFKLVKQKFYDARWIVVEEPYEITTGERPSELMIYLKEDLTSPKMQNKTEPGNRIKVVGVLKELPRKVKGTRSRQMEIYLDANSIESIEVGWEELEITPEDEKKILELAKDPDIYSKFIASIAPTMYGMEEVKEALLLQLVGGEPHLLEDGTRIRGNIHILLVGDPACLVGDERVFLGDGTIAKIKNLGSYHLQDISVPVRVKGKEIQIAKTFHVYENQPVIEIITESGKSLKGTPNQPVLVVEGQERKWKRLDELKIGDRVAVVPSISCWKKSLVLTGWEKPNRKFGPKFRGKIPDKWYPELGAFVGYLLGDGYVRENKGEIVAFVNEDEADLIEPLVKYIENLFRLKPIVEKFKGHSHTYQGRNIKSKKYLYRIILRSKDLAKNLKFLKEKRVPDPIFLSPNAVVKEFLKWLFQADGSVFYKGRGRMGIQLKQKEIELLRDVQMLLLRFGIHSRIYGNNLTIRRGYDILKFAKSIGFVSNNKKAKLSELSEHAKKFKRVKRKLSERVVAIKKLKGLHTVYDIEVPKSHRFIANGIIVHNSGKSQLMQYISKLIPRGRYVSGSGVTGVGLCTVYDTLIQLEDGTLMKIGDLVEREFKKNKPEKVKDGIYRVKASDELKILAFNQKNLKIEPKKITYYWKLKAPHELVEIETRSGKKIIVTPENPIPIVNHGKIVWIKAKDLKPNHYIATPRIIRVSPKLQTILSKIEKNAHVLNSFSTVAYLIEKIKEKYTLREFCRKFGINEGNLYYNWKKYSPNLAELEKIANCLSINLEEILPNELWLSQYHGHQLKLPLHLNEGIMYLMGLLAGDGSISKTSLGGFDIKFFNIHDYLLDAFSSLCEEVIGIKPSYDEDRNGVPYYRFRSKIFGNLLKKFGIPDGDKSHNLTISEELSKLPNVLISPYLRGVFDTDGSVIKVKGKGSNFIELSSASEEFIRGVQLILLRFGIISRIRERKPKTSKIRGKIVKSGKKYVLEIRGIDNLKKFEESIGFSLPEKSRKLKEIIEKISKEHTNVDLVPQIGELLKEARKKLKLSAKNFYGYKNYSYERNKRYPTRNFLQSILNEFGIENLEKLEKFANSDIFWDRVRKVKIFENKEHEYVYDVSVEDAHSFVGNGIVIHNTAAVTRDEEFLGGWVLEGGAIVMSNKSVCCIDEFNKVSPSDRVALQEAMSLETISIAKASIVATLPAQTAILAGANPKLGRFDPYLPIREQVDIDDVLLSRFDLKFALRDVPNPELDAKMAEHILKVRHLKTEEAKPIIPPEFLRKYIAYARAKVHPVLTKEAGELLMNFYLEMRKKSGEEAPIAITLRQYEALIRLAEASAKVQLRNFVTKEDAERAIRLMKISLREFGFEPETGMFDIDRAEGQRVTAAQRSKIRVMIDILEELTTIHGKNIPQEEFLKRAKEEGVEDAEEIMRKMISEGIIFQPKPGFIQKV